MNRLYYFILAFFLLTSSKMYAGFGAWASAVYLNPGTTNSNFYNCMKPGGILNISNLDYTGDLGSYPMNSNTLQLTGGEVKTFKSNSDVCGVKMCYTVYPYGERPQSPSFTCIDLYFYQNCCLDELQANCSGSTNAFPGSTNGSCSSGDQKWQSPGSNFNTAFPIDLTQRALGKYEMEVYFVVYGDNDSDPGCSSNEIIYDNNNGSNYKASFTIMAILPEKNCLLDLKYINKTVDISWMMTHVELYNSFLIQHSVDGNHFYTVMEKENDLDRLNLVNHFTHKDPSNGNNYYRILAKDKNGDSYFSEISKIFIYKSLRHFFLILSNDASIIKIDFPDNWRSVSMAVFNSFGQYIQGIKSVNNNEFIDFTDSPPGHYILRIVSSDGVKALPFLKQ